MGKDGRLDLPRLLDTFQRFFRENGEIRGERFDYKEAGPQLLMQAFLQRIVNSGGRIDREYGLGRRRTDLLVQWPLAADQGFHGPVQRAVIDLKILYKSLEATIEEGLAQTADYMDRSDTSEGYLVIFDRTPDTPWEKRSLPGKGGVENTGLGCGGGCKSMPLSWALPVDKKETTNHANPREWIRADSRDS